MARHRVRNTAIAAAALGSSGVAARSARLLWRRRNLNWAPPERYVQDAYLSCQTMGAGNQPVLLLHSVEGSANYFGAAFDELAEPGPLLVPDLLGFGRSPASDDGYSPEAHVAALIRMLDELKITLPILVVGHGLGAVLGLKMASQQPERVAAVVALGAPIYRDSAGARTHLKTTRAAGRVGRRFSLVVPGRLRMGARLPRLVAGSVHLDLPLPVAGAKVAARTAAAFEETLRSCLVESNAAEWFSQISCPVELVIPAHDASVDVGLLRELSDRHPNVTVNLLPFGDERLPLTHPDGCLAAIDRFRFGRMPAVPTGLG
ncbi:MAG TPA: alpha/beta hydrolase [Candidatus Nanopelagicaceae bacterium]|nr:alpha/beta hydrolase [Candidatus Nanopelagicaceae bacterium]